MSHADLQIFLEKIMGYSAFILDPYILLTGLLIMTGAFLYSVISGRRKNLTLRTALAHSKVYLTETQERITELEARNTSLQVERTRLETMLESEEKLTREKLAVMEGAKEELKLQFTALAQNIFDHKSDTFTNQSKERIGNLLAPFNIQLSELKQEIRDTYLNDTRERAELGKELASLQELNRRITQEAVNLTRALKGDRKIQGNWGEMVLERLLEQSGLQHGREYQTQKGYRDQNNRLYKPDVVLHLPRERSVIVDSKVSLSAWERFCSSDDPKVQKSQLGELVTAIRNHVFSLAEKRYEELQGLNSLDFVMMFMPIDAAFLAALNHDEQLLTDAQKQKVVIVTPSTLLATLKTVENLWRYENQSKNSLEIARKAGTLYDKFRGLVEDLDKIGRQLDSCRTVHGEAMTKLSRGRGNLLSQTQQLLDLGVQVKKELPKSLLDQDDQELRN